MKKSLAKHLGTAAFISGLCVTGNAAAYNFNSHALMVSAAIASMHYGRASTPDVTQWCPNAGELPTTQDFQDFLNAVDVAQMSLPNLTTALQGVDQDVSSCSQGPAPYYSDDNLDRMGSVQIKDFRYIVTPSYKNACGLRAIPTAELPNHNWRILGSVLGAVAGEVDQNVDDTHLWFRPLNAGYWGLMKDGVSWTWNVLGGIALAPIACFFSLFSGHNCWDSANNFAHQYNPVDYATGWIPGWGDMTSLWGENFTGLWHFIETNGPTGPYTFYNSPPGMYYLQAGPSWIPGAFDTTIIASSAATGLSLNAQPGQGSWGVERYGQYDDTPRSWVSWQAHSLGLTEFSPIDNLALYGKNRYDSMLKNGMHISAEGLGYPLHALADASFPQHIANTTSWGHRAMEDAINDEFAKVMQFESTAPVNAPWTGNDFFKDCHRSVAIMLKAYSWWQYFNMSSGGHIDVRELVKSLATFSRPWLDSHQNVWNDSASDLFLLGARETAKAPYKNGDYDGMGLQLPEFAWHLTLESTGAILAYLIDAGQNVYPLSQFDPLTKCPANTHFVHNAGCQAGPPPVVTVSMPQIAIPALNGVGQSCATDSDCSADLVCSAYGTCEVPWAGCGAVGAPCTAGSDCCSGLCDAFNLCFELIIE